MTSILEKYYKYINNKILLDIKDKHILLDRLIKDTLLIIFITEEELNNYLDIRTLHLDNKSTVELQIDELIELNKNKNKLESVKLYYNHKKK